MKKFFAALMVVAGLASMNSCKTCVNCRPVGGGTAQTVCKSDFNNNQTLYDAAITSYRASGYSCS